MMDFIDTRASKRRPASSGAGLCSCLLSSACNLLVAIVVLVLVGALVIHEIQMSNEFAACHIQRDEHDKLNREHDEYKTETKATITKLEGRVDDLEKKLEEARDLRDKAMERVGNVTHLVERMGQTVKDEADGRRKAEKATVDSERKNVQAEKKLATKASGEKELYESLVKEREHTTSLNAELARARSTVDQLRRLIKVNAGARASEAVDMIEELSLSERRASKKKAKGERGSSKKKKQEEEESGGGGGGGEDSTPSSSEAAEATPAPSMEASEDAADVAGEEEQTPENRRKLRGRKSDGADAGVAEGGEQGEGDEAPVESPPRPSIKFYSDEDMKEMEFMKKRSAPTSEGEEQNEDSSS